VGCSKANLNTVRIVSCLLGVALVDKRSFA
jgi:hypothetical protein